MRFVLKGTSTGLRVKMSKPKPLTNKQKDILRELLPKVIKKFAHDNEDHVSDNKSYFDVWLEMPNMPQSYVSLGFTPEKEPLYWWVPPVTDWRLNTYKARGYDDSYKSGLWKYVDIKKEFWSQAPSVQESWLIKLFEELLHEDEELRGM